MDFILIILVIFYVAFTISNIIIENKRIKEMDKMSKLCSKLIDTQTEITNILIKADLTKENYFETIEKIKSILMTAKSI